MTPQSSDLILRPRLLSALAGRFDRRLTVVEAGPGFGKSTLIRQSIGENEILNDGIDVLVRCWPGLEPIQLAQEISEQLAMAVGQSAGQGSIVDGVWAAAPRHVCLILDDFHRISGDSPTLDLVDSLLRDLPNNGHVLVGGRPPTRLGLARLLAAGEVLRIDEEELGFDAKEIEEVLGQELALAADSRARWPALASLIRTVGESASEAYLFEEVLRPVPPERRKAFARLSLFEQADQKLAAALGVDEDLHTFLAPLPLVPIDDAGVARFHGMWRPILDGELSAVERAQALQQGGSHLRSTGWFVRAAESFARAGDLDSLSEMATQISGHMLSATQLATITSIYQLLPDNIRATKLGLHLRAIGSMDRSLPETTRQLEELAARAEAEGDFHLAVTALWRSIQIHGLVAGFPAGPELAVRVQAMADKVGPLGHAVVARHEAVSALIDGRALDAIDIGRAGFSGFGPDQATLFANLAIDALHPQAVLDSSETISDEADSLDEDDLSNQGIVDFFGAQAVWYLGLVDPAEVAPTAISLTRMVGAQHMRHQDLIMNCVVTTVLLAVGEIAEAERTAGIAEDLSQEFEGMHLRVCGHVARAAILSNQGKSDDAAGELLRALEVAPIKKWPHRPYTAAISALAAMPSSPLAEVPVDQMGLPFQIAVAAGTALKSARKGDPTEAIQLPWDQPWLLRSHVWPEDLTELAVAALTAPDCPYTSDIRSVLDSIPAVGLRLQRIAAGELQLRPEVSELAAALSVAPDLVLQVRTLGQLLISVDDIVVSDDSWTRRERVRELMALIVHRRRITRNDAILALWPDAPADKGSANLRTNLRHLQNALNPDRGTNDDVRFILADNTWLELNIERVRVDSVRFEKMIAEARSSENQGAPSVALGQYQGALELYEGDYLTEFNVDFAEFDRIRLRSLAAQASVRVAELLLAQGEPEESVRAANRAVALEDLFERAHRARVRALLGQEDRAAARLAMQITLRTLADATLDPEPDTTRLATTLGL